MKKHNNTFNGKVTSPTLRCLSDLSVTECGVILSLPRDMRIRNKLMNIGLTVGCSVECIGESPLGDPRAYLVREGVIALRHEDACEIIIE